MTEIRSQRLKQAEVENANKMAGYQGLASGISSFGSAIGSGIGKFGAAMQEQQQQQRGDAVARSLIDQQQGLPPLGPTSPSMQSATNAYNAGGLQELGLRQSMGQMKGQKPADLMSQIRLMFQAKADKRAEDAVVAARTDKNFNNMTDQAKDLYKDSLGYLDNGHKLLAEIEKAPDEQSFNALTTQLRALNSVNAGRKLSVPSSRSLLLQGERE
jgi:hypothetical protein